MGEAKVSADRLIVAIKGTGGIKHAIAVSLGVHRNSIDNYLRRYPTARIAYEDEVQNIGDMAENVIFQNIKAGDVDSAKWYARMKLKDRGYVERQEVTGADGGDIVIKVVYDKDV